MGILDVLSGIPGMLYPLVQPLIPFLEVLFPLFILTLPLTSLIATIVLLVVLSKTKKDDEKRSVRLAFTIVFGTICAVTWITLISILVLLFTGNISFM